MSDESILGTETVLEVRQAHRDHCLGRRPPQEASRMFKNDLKSKLQIKITIITSYTSSITCIEQFSTSFVNKHDFHTCLI